VVLWSSVWYRCLGPQTNQAKGGTAGLPPSPLGNLGVHWRPKGSSHPTPFPPLPPAHPPTFHPNPPFPRPPTIRCQRGSASNLTLPQIAAHPPEHPFRTRSCVAATELPHSHTPTLTTHRDDPAEEKEGAATPATCTFFALQIPRPLRRKEAEDLGQTATKTTLLIRPTWTPTSHHQPPLGLPSHTQTKTNPQICRSLLCLLGHSNRRHDHDRSCFKPTLDTNYFSPERPFLEPYRISNFAPPKERQRTTA